jgi:hypothetical protein
VDIVEKCGRTADVALRMKKVEQSKSRIALRVGAMSSAKKIRHGGSATASESLDSENATEGCT